MGSLSNILAWVAARWPNLSESRQARAARILHTVNADAAPYHVSQDAEGRIVLRYRVEVVVDLETRTVTERRIDPWS